MLTKTSPLLLLVIFIVACTPSRTVSERQIGDNNLSCIEIAERVAELNALKALAEKEHLGFENWSYSTLTSVGGQNIASVNARKSVLADYYNQRKCTTEVPEYSLDEIKEKIENGNVKELNG